jgi:uncharacterized protein (TIGR03546 family)
MSASKLRPVRSLFQSLLAHNGPDQLAAGFALGMVLGLVPKGNLIAVSLLVLLFSLRVNTGIGLLAAFAFSWVGPVLDPFADKLGAYVLNAPTMQSTYAAMFQWPLGPWFDFDNTVVIGSLVIGLYASYPVFWCVDRVCRRLQAAAATPYSANNLGLDDPVGRRAA